MELEKYCIIINVYTAPDAQKNSQLFKDWWWDTVSFHEVISKQ